MSDQETFDPREVAAAERLDAGISAMLSGKAPAGADPVALWLATSLRADPGPGVRRPGAAPRVYRAWRWRPALPQWAAAVLCLLFLGHGVGNILFGEWVAENLGEPFNAHAMTEGAWATAAVGLAVGLGALRRRFLPASVGAGVPLGVLLGVNGVHEIGVFTAGAVLHLSEGLVAIVLLVTWLVGRRYSASRYQFDAKAAGREGESW